MTSRSNYVEFDKLVPDDIIANPDLVATRYPLVSAAFFFNKNGLWIICDKGSDRAAVESVTKRVNGGLTGIEDRWKYFQKYYAIFA